MRDLLHAALVVTCLALVAVAPVHAQADPVALWLTQVTTQRLNAGLPPLELSPQLAAAAQRHANDLAANGLKSPTGSDASSPQQRITEAGYVAWTLDDGDPVIGEIYYVGSEPADQAFAVFLQDTPSVDVLLDPRFREIGIGIAADSAGVSYHVLTLGARPNVLPIFINDGAPSAVDPVVAIHLTNETVRTEGQGAAAIGKAIEFRIGDQPNWEELPWQPWEELVPWALPTATGEHRVYVQYRDAAGRTAASVDSIFLATGEPATATPFALQPDAIPPSEDTSSPEQQPQSTLAPAPPETAATATATRAPVAVTPFPTWTPLPSATPPPEPEQTDLPIGLVATLEAIAVLLGGYLILHRGRTTTERSDESQDGDG